VKKPTFENKFQEINVEIYKRKHKWNLTSLAWMDFDDVAQILRIHIHKKWKMYDPDQPLAPWINRIVSNQIKNLIRNNYGNYSRPCLKCAAAEDEENGSMASSGIASVGRRKSRFVEQHRKQLLHASMSMDQEEYHQ
jgi:DNA-directed RNA polymerase specialized sigma24 family protein